MEDVPIKPVMHLKEQDEIICLEAEHCAAGTYFLYVDEDANWLFTENETNRQKLYSQSNPTPYVKDAFHRYLIEMDKSPPMNGISETSILLC